MKENFAALRFSGDANLNGRVYWYLAPFPVKEGDEVLAPVGARDRLQRAIVERALTAEEEFAPYDIRLCKRVEAYCGDRARRAGGVDCTELGGVRYDDRHYTRFGRLLIAAEAPTEPLTDILAVCPADMGTANALKALINAKNCVLFYGGGAREIGNLIIRFARGEAALPLTESEARALQKKLL